MPFRDDVVGARARDRPRPGLRLRPDPPGIALHHGCALGRRRVGPDAADAGDRALDGAARSACRTRPALIADRDTNLRLGTAYLKLVLDDFGGSQALAAAAYNAGPGRPRKWREGPVARAGGLGREHPVPRDARLRQEGADATRRYYAALLGGSATHAWRSKARLGPPDRTPAADRTRPTAGAPSSARTALRRRRRHLASPMSTPRARRHRLRRPQRSAKSSSSAPAAPTAASRVPTRRPARGARTCSCCRRSRSSPADVHDDDALARLRARHATPSSTSSASCTAAKPSSSASTSQLAAPPRAGLHAPPACTASSTSARSAPTSDAPSRYLRSKAARRGGARGDGARPDGAAPFGRLRRGRSLPEPCSRACRRRFRCCRWPAPRARFQPVWVEDVAAAIVRCLDDRTTIGETIECAGPSVVHARGAGAHRRTLRRPRAPGPRHCRTRLGAPAGDGASKRCRASR